MPPAPPSLASPPTPRRRGPRWWTAFAVAATALTGLALYAHVRLTAGMVLLARLADTDAAAERAGPELVEEALDIPGVGRVRTFAPRGGARRAVLFVHGVHHRGIDEPRLIAAARKLAGVGLAIATPHIDELARAEIDAGALGRIERAALWLARESKLVRAGDPIGIIGICFGGGLAVAAAGRDALAPHLAFVLALGGYDSLEDELRYLATGRGADGALRPPDPYGQAVVLRLLAARLVPVDQVQGLREALAPYLADDHDAARALIDRLDEPARTLAGLPLARDTHALGAALLPHLGHLAPDPALSAATSPPPRCPVFLIHAAGDTIMLPEHSVRLAARLAPHTETRMLVTPLFDHVDPGQGGWGDTLALAEILTDMLHR